VIRRLAALSLGFALLPAAAGAVAFSQADLNHDGFVTYPEAEVVFPQLKHIQFQKCDPNGDGRLDQTEYPLLNNFYWIIEQND
jgi:hypothetical protein